MLVVKAVAILLLTTVTIAAFIMPPPLAQMESGGEASRLFFFHVPMAQVSFIAFIVAALFGIAYLRNRKPDQDRYATVSADIGLTFSIIALITGSLWAKQAWGAYWNWDPRQLFLFALILFYGAYFALRQATTDREVRRRVSAVYLVFGGAISPFLYFVLPRLYRSLHEDANEVVLSAGDGSTMSGPVTIVFLTAITGFLLLYVWLLRLGVDAARIEASHIGEG